MHVRNTHVHIFTNCPPKWAKFLRIAPSGMLGIVRIAANLPEVSFHGGFTTCGVALCEESLLVLVDLHEVRFTSVDGACYSRETCLSGNFISGVRSRALVSVCLADVQTCALGVLCGSRTVRAGEVRSAGVAILHLRLCE